MSAFDAATQSVPPNSKFSDLRVFCGLIQVKDMEESDDLVAELIIRKLKSASVVVSFAEVAREAKARNRNRLAAQVLADSGLSNVIVERGSMELLILFGGCVVFSCWTMRFMQKIKYHC